MKRVDLAGDAQTSQCRPLGHSYPGTDRLDPDAGNTPRSLNRSVHHLVLLAKPLKDVELGVELAEVLLFVRDHALEQLPCDRIDSGPLSINHWL